MYNPVDSGAGPDAPQNPVSRTDFEQLTGFMVKNLNPAADREDFKHVRTREDDDAPL